MKKLRHCHRMYTQELSDGCTGRPDLSTEQVHGLWHCVGRHYHKFWTSKTTRRPLLYINCG